MIVLRDGGMNTGKIKIDGWMVEQLNTEIGK